jgi:hypothetical protein
MCLLSTKQHAPCYFLAASSGRLTTARPTDPNRCLATLPAAPVTYYWCLPSHPVPHVQLNTRAAYYSVVQFRLCGAEPTRPEPVRTL